MTIKQELEQELDEAYERFLSLVELVPEPDYSLPSSNPAWTVGDILFHITLGPRALAFEVWMTLHARGLYKLAMRYFPSRMFNRLNAWFGSRKRRISRQGLRKAYGKAHAVAQSRLRRVREEDLSTSVTYPKDYVSDLAGEISVERLFRYIKRHFEAHEREIRACLG
ncbi:MAG: DinB family protein [Anaerolineales bacterium]|nr:MAG: DinB family protein [Anaerolineales bacterium]